MPRHTKKEKIRRSFKRTHASSPRSSSPSTITHDPNLQFRIDTVKSLKIVLAIIALEIALYYGTMNNLLSFIMKLR